MHRNGRMAGTIALLLGLAACTTPTPSQPAPNGIGGYTVTQIENDRFRLSFNGNSITPRQTVDNDLTYLAARVTLLHGGDWFLMSHDASDKSTAYPTFLSPGIYQGNGLTSPLYVPATVQTDFANPQESWTSTATILVRQGAKPANNPDAYDARNVEAHLTPLIRRGQAGPY
jgi:hypothetical protein